MNTSLCNPVTCWPVLFLSAFCLLTGSVTAQSAAGKGPDKHRDEHTATAKFPTADAYRNTKLNYKIISALNGTFGYDIYANGKLMIHQNNIPAMPGNEGFKTKAAAEKVAQLVIEKIKKGEMPPTVSIEEMIKLKAISK